MKLRRLNISQSRIYLVGISAALLLTIFAIAIIMVLNNENNHSNILDMLSANDCIRACWEGIEPNVASQMEVQNWLTEREIQYDVVTGLLDEANGVYEWSTQSAADSPMIAVAFSDGVVAQITLPIEFCVTTVIDTYGIPDHVSDGNDYKYLIYLDEGIVFSINNLFNSSLASVAYMVSDTIMGGFTDSEAGNWDKSQFNLDDNCVTTNLMR